MGKRGMRASEELRARARELRREMTPAEARLWNGLRGWRVAKFRRQHPIDRFVLDFYCPAARVCVEVDGGVHDPAEQRERDGSREEALAARGIRVIRFRNDEVLRDTRAVLRRIRAELPGQAVRRSPKLQEPARAGSIAPPASPLPRAGEGGGPQAGG